MDTLTSRAWTPGSAAASGGPVRGVIPGLTPEAGWLVLRDCALGGDGPRVGLALIHPGLGVAFVDFAPSENDVVDRFRKALDERRFPAIFGGYPPVVKAVLPADRVPDLGRVIVAEFMALPPLSLAGGDAWLRSARAAIEAEPRAGVPEPLRARRRRAFPWRAAAFAAVAGGAVASFMAVLAPPGRGPGNAASLPLPMATAQHVAVDDAPGGDNASGDLTASDVRAALASADGTIGAGAGAATEARVSQGAAASAERPEPPAAPAHAVADSPAPSWHASRAEAPPKPSVASKDAPPSPAGAAPASASPWPERASAATAAIEASLAESPPGPPPPADGSASRLRRDPPRRTTSDVSGAAADAAPRPATQAVAPDKRRAALPATPADPGRAGRCNAITARAMVGGALSDEEREYLRRGCDRRG